VTTTIAIAFFYGGVKEKKKATTVVAITFFYGGVAKKKKTTTSFVSFIDGFIVEKGVVVSFGGFITKKVTTVMLLPSFMVVVL
jgi:succinate-acetate transporter protein